MREKDKFGGKESERAQCEGSCGKSRSFTYDRKRICVTTPNVDVNKVRKKKIRKGSEKGKMNVGRRKTMNRERAKSEIIRVRDKARENEAKGQGSKRDSALSSEHLPQGVGGSTYYVEKRKVVDGFVFPGDAREECPRDPQRDISKYDRSEKYRQHRCGLIDRA